MQGFGLQGYHAPHAPVSAGVHIHLPRTHALGLPSAPSVAGGPNTSCRLVGGYGWGRGRGKLGSWHFWDNSEQICSAIHPPNQFTRPTIDMCAPPCKHSMPLCESFDRPNNHLQSPRLPPSPPVSSSHHPHPPSALALTMTVPITTNHPIGGRSHHGP